MLDNEYVLEDCKDCIHKGVCMFKTTFSALKQSSSLPMDFNSVSCTEHLSDSMLADLVSDYDEDDEDDIDEDTEDLVDYDVPDVNEYAEEVLSGINSAIRRITKKGWDIQTIQINAKTYDTLKKANILKEKKGKGYIHTPAGNIPVAIITNARYGEFFILYLDEGSED